jgi:Spy/CpxP family protein refolding chaperone
MYRFLLRPWRTGVPVGVQCLTPAPCGPSMGPAGWTHFSAGGEREFSSGPFAVRRPLRFLAHHLQLDDRQVAEIARILDDLKTERAQAEVDDRRTQSALAEAMSAEEFDESRAAQGVALRVGSAERLRDAVLRALRSMHAILRPEQRERFATLIRTGRLAL